MKSTDQYFDCRVHPSGVVAQDILNGLFYSTEGRFIQVRPERAQLLPRADLDLVLSTYFNAREVKIATLLDYVAATSNAMGRPGLWMNAHNGVDARIAHFVLLTQPKVHVSVKVVDGHTFMPAFGVDVSCINPISTMLDAPSQLLHSSFEPTLSHVINQLLRWRDVSTVENALLGVLSP